MLGPKVETNNVTLNVAICKRWAALFLTCSKTDDNRAADLVPQTNL
jgi:hypothetical protein